MFSDVYYVHQTGEWFALADGGGTLPYETRVERFEPRFDESGAIVDFKIVETILFVDTNGRAFQGKNPLISATDPLITDKSVNVSSIANAFDPEGLVVGPGGHFFVADEFGPSVYEFTRAGVFQRAFATPKNLVTRSVAGGVETIDFFSQSNKLALGRQVRAERCTLKLSLEHFFCGSFLTPHQDNRGYEGLAIRYRFFSTTSTEF